MMEPWVFLLIAAMRWPTSRQRTRRLDGRRFSLWPLHDLRDLLGIARGVGPRCRCQYQLGNGAADARILAEPAPHDSEMHALLALMVIPADWPIAGTHPARSELRALREGSDAFDPMVL